MTNFMKKLKKYEFSAIIEKDENGYFFAKVPLLKGCHTQAKTLSELYERLDEVIHLCLEVEEKEHEKLLSVNKFVGFQKIEVLKYA